MPDLLARVREALAGRYEVTDEVGRGGMSVVFRAREVKHGREVALKVLAPDLAMVVGAERFLREIEFASRLQHPHIVPLFDSGEADGLLYFVMPLVDGETLRDRLEREGALPADEAIDIARQVASALEAAHRQGIVHRDIKPANIMLSGGAAVVTDFGIAGAVGEAGGDRLTATGLAVGSPRYMSPEQAGGLVPDERGDLYSLGCVLYEMLTGVPPFEGDTFLSLLGKHATEPVPPLKGTRTAVPHAAERALYRVLEKRPEDRFPDAGAFRTALTHAPGFRGTVSDVWTDLWRRRVPQTLVAYSVLTWLIVLSVRWLVDRLVLSPLLPGFALTALLALLPSAAIVAYFHGGSGRSWPPAERLGVTLNAVGAAALLFALYWGKDLGSATRTVTVTDAAGREVERIVPKPEFRRRLGVFYFSPSPDDPSDAWLSYGLPLALEADLAQDLMLDVTVGFDEELRREGVADPTRTPRALALRLAREEGLGYVLVGELGGTMTGVETTLLETRHGRALATATWEVDGSRPFDLVDSLSVFLRRELAIPSAYMQETTDLPASDVLTADAQALRLWARGVFLARAATDPEGASDLLTRAVERDSTFALAWNELSLLALAGGRTDEAIRDKEMALAADWRLPEARRLAILQGFYVMRGELDRAARLAETRVVLLPDDLEARAQLASLYTLRRKPDEAAEQYRALQSLEPDNLEFVRLRAEAYRRAGRLAEAADAYREYHAAAGEDPEVLGEIGAFFREAGEPDSARAYLEAAVLLSPRSPGLLLELARAQRDAGDRKAALASLNEALSAADSPDEEFEVRRALSEHFQSLGRLREARAQADTAYRVSTEFQHEIQQDITRLEMLDLVALTDGPAPALAEASDIQGRLPRPFAGLAAYGPFRVYRALRDPGGLENATRAFREGVARTPFAGSFEDEIAEAEGYVYLWRGECAAAVERLTEATELVPGSLDARLALARARLCSGDLSGASSELESAARLSPADPTLQMLRAELSLAGGDTVSARRDLDAALDAWAGADPGFGPREEALRLRSAL